MLVIAILSTGMTTGVVLAQDRPTSPQQLDQQAKAAFDLKKYPEALALFQKAADRGDALAEAWLGWMYQNGNGVTRDNGQALNWYRKAADQNNTFAQHNLGFMYHGGQGVQQDYGLAVTWFRRAADLGNADSQFMMGQYYINGFGVKQDPAQAVGWYRKAAAQGNAIAQIQLGSSYYSGKGVSQDYAQAMVWFRKAADQNYMLAHFFIGAMYLQGAGIKPDYGKAMMSLRKVTDLEAFPAGFDPVADADKVKMLKAQANFMIGAMYEEGIGVSKDIAEAISWYSKAAELGKAEAKAKLTQLHENPPAKRETINLVCQNSKGKRYVTIDKTDKSVSIQNLIEIQYRDGDQHYVTINEQFVEFGCRKQSSEGDILGGVLGAAFSKGKGNDDGLASMVRAAMCVARHRIDLGTGLWTARTANLAENSECSLLSLKH
jgi:TPR repeat protein